MFYRICQERAEAAGEGAESSGACLKSRVSLPPDLEKIQKKCFGILKKFRPVLYCQSSVHESCEMM